MRQLSRIVYSFGLSGINRVNQEKQIEISYQFLPEVNESKSLLEAARAEVDRMVADLRIPSGTAVQVEHGENEFREFFFLIAAAIVLIYMILASVFESFVAPVVMMFTIPLAAIGSFWALILTGNSLLVASSLTGFLILLGVVVNNGIIFIDYTRILRGRGFRRSRALMTAGQARVRPILITAITTIVAMFPLAMGKTETAALVGAPFAITVIGGLSISTLFTLVLIPVVYSGVEKALEWLRGLGLWIKVVQLAVFITGCWLIYINIDSLLWRLAGLFGIVNLIPGFTYLVMASLRSARETFIAPGEPITIVVRNLSKVYDHPARFIREWNKGKRISAGAEAAGRNGSGPEYDGFFWQLPLLGFAVFFAYGYLGSSFWFLVLSFSIYFYLFFVLLSIRRFLARGTASRGWPERERTIGIVRRVILWAYPAQSLGFLYLRTRSIALTLFVAIIWYLALVIYTTSERLHRDRVDINRISGRFAFLRRQFYRFVQIIPLLGRRRQPFRALSGVTLEIGHGMFGLLGPNGAGKTTLMRMICGVLDQSYGKIWINGYDTFEKREELQSLIGYLPQEFGTYEGMTAYEFLEYQAMLKNILDREERANRIDYVLGAVHIEEHRDEKIGSFSGGMKQRIGIAQTLLHLPRILVVDEPTAGLDPRERIRFRNLLVDLSRERIVIFSTHVIEDISSSCRLVAVLNRGELRYLDSPVKMTEIARGHVWQFGVPLAEFDDIRKKHFLVHHMRDGDRIRVRCLAEYRPVAYAQPIDPTLEDAYLWLLREDTR